ncbi:MAG: hypothetical protein K0Q46_6175 [Rhodococcus erythropolis]|nr:hypothetical protein [Rhodococcus erythropolis]
MLKSSARPQRQVAPRSAQNYPLDMHLTFAATYDPDADASYIYVASDRANGDAVRQQHVYCDGSDGQIILDYDRDGRLLGIELLGASSLLRASALSTVEQPETGP